MTTSLGRTAICTWTCIVTVGSSFGAAPNPQTQQFLDQKNAKALFDGCRLVALFGPQLAVNEAQNNTAVLPTAQFVANFVNENSDAFGVVGVDLVAPDQPEVIRDGKYAIFKHLQRIDGLFVHNSVVTIPVLRMPGGEERIGYIGIRLVEPPPGGFPVDTVNTIGDAIPFVTAVPEYASLDTFSAPEAKVIYEDKHGHVHRAWRFTGSDSAANEPNMFLFMVDAGDGSLVSAGSLGFEAGLTGTAHGRGTNIEQNDPLQHRAPRCDNPTVLMPLPGAQITVYDDLEPACPSDGGTALATQFATVDWVEPGRIFGPNAGTYSFGQVDLPVRVRSELVGQWVRVVDQANQLVVACEEVVETGSPPHVPLVLSADSSEFPCPLECLTCPEIENFVGQVNAFVVLQSAHDFFKALQPAFDGLDVRVDCYVNELVLNLLGFTVPLYSPPRITLGAGLGNFANSAFSTSLSHEYGHVLGGSLLGFRVYDTKAFGEGASDVFAALHWSTPRIALGVTADGEALRDLHLADARWAPPVGSLCGATELPEWCSDPASEHCCGLVLGGSFWDLRTDIVNDESIGEPETVINNLFADFMFLTDAGWDPSLLLEALLATDLDGDLSNNLPGEHADKIIEAFEAHGLSVSLGNDCANDIVVEWVTANPSVQPVLSIDYDVICDMDPPAIVLKTSVSHEAGPVSRWRIGRLRDGDRAQDLGLIIAEWAQGANQDITVEVGTIQQPDAPIQNVSIVDIPRQDASHWSNIRLALMGDLRVRASCQGANGLGGRISGTINGNAGVINAESVGQGEAGPGELIMGSVDSQGNPTLGEYSGGTLESIPANSLLRWNTLRAPVSVNGDVHGRVEFAYAPGGTSTHAVVIHGELGVSGTVSAGYLQGAAIKVDQLCAGAIEVDRMTDGAEIPLIQVGSLAGTIRINDPLVSVGGLIEVGSSNEPGNVRPGGSVIVLGPFASPSGVYMFPRGVEIHGAIEGGGLVQLAGGLANGSSVSVEGSLNGTLEVLGTSVHMDGSIDVSGDVAPGQSGGAASLTIEPSLWSNASVSVHGDVESNGRLQLKGGSDTGSVVTVDGNVAGTVTVGVPATFGGDVAGTIEIGGALSNAFSHYGRLLDTGVISIGSIGTLGRYIQSATSPAGPWSGSLVVENDMNGTMTFATKLENADITIGGAMASKGGITIHEMASSTLALNTNDFCADATIGTINIGEASTLWDADANGHVDLGSIDIYGDLGTPTQTKGGVVFRGCNAPTSPTLTTMGDLCVHRHKYGKVTNLVCAPKPAIIE